MTRRTVLGVAAAVSAVVVPGGLQTSAAHAAKRPPLGDGPNVAIGPQAQQVTTNAGEPGIQLTLLFVEPGDGTAYFVDELSINRIRVSNIDPSLLLVSGRESLHIVGSPISATGPATVVLRYHRGSDPSITLPEATVTVLPAQAQPPKPPKPAKPAKPAKPPKPPDA